MNPHSAPLLIDQIKAVRKGIVLLKAKEKSWDHLLFLESTAQTAEIRIMSPQKEAELVRNFLSDEFERDLEALQNKYKRLRDLMDQPHPPAAPSSTIDTHSEKDWLTEKEAANYLGLHKESLARLRRQGLSPKFSRIGNGKSIRYSRKDVEDYLTSKAAS